MKKGSNFKSLEIKVFNVAIFMVVAFLYPTTYAQSQASGVGSLVAENNLDCEKISYAQSQDPKVQDYCSKLTVKKVKPIKKRKHLSPFAGKTRRTAFDNLGQGVNGIFGNNLPEGGVLNIHGQPTSIDPEPEDQPADLKIGRMDFQEKVFDSEEQEDARDRVQRFTTRDENDISTDAPGSFRKMIEGIDDGNYDLAREGAGDFVKYMVKQMYRVSEASKLIIEEFAAQNRVSDDEIVGASQYMDQQFAKAREETNSIFKPTHQDSLDRITPGEDGKVQIYYFLSLSCRFCRDMGPDIERLWQIAKADKNIQMVGLLVGNHERDWIKSYRDYTGLTLPFIDGHKAAKALRIGFLPSLVILTPSNNQSYLRTGQISFERMYQIVRKAQGRSFEPTPLAQRLVASKIGTLEKNNIKYREQMVARGKDPDKAIPYALRESGDISYTDYRQRKPRREKLELGTF